MLEASVMDRRLSVALDGVPLFDPVDYDDPAPVVTANCQAAAGCTAAQMAANDVAQWETSVAAALPLGAATVCLDSTPVDGTSAAPACDSSGLVYAVKIWWDDDRDGTLNQRFVMTFQP